MNNSQSIRNRAAIVTFSCGAWTGKRIDKRVSREVQSQHGHTGTARYRKHLMESGVKRVIQARTAAYTAHYQMTAPWGHSGIRIIKAELLPEYTSVMRKLKGNFFAAVEDLIQAMPQLLADEAEIWAGLFNVNDYPTIEELRRKHYFSVSIEPLPEHSGDWRLDLSDDLLAELAEDYDAEYDNRLKQAMLHTWNRLYESLNNLSEKLHRDETKGFRQSVIDGVVEVARSLNGLNFTDDDKLDEMAKDVISRLGTVQADLIRTSPDSKDKTQADVDEIMEKMSAFMA